MEDRAWPYGRPPDALGAVVHGPALLARQVGITVGLRCVFAHPDGLHIPLVLAARGEPADRAGSVRFGRVESSPILQLTATMNGRSGPVDSTQTEGRGGTGTFDQRSTYWINALPEDGRLRLSVAWPEIGLAETITDLLLGDLDDLEDRVIPLA